MGIVPESMLQRIELTKLVDRKSQEAEGRSKALAYAKDLLNSHASFGTIRTLIEGSIERRKEVISQDIKEKAYCDTLTELLREIIDGKS